MDEHTALPGAIKGKEWTKSLKLPITKEACRKIGGHDRQ
jgi:hypothetical protein